MGLISALHPMCKAPQTLCIMYHRKQEIQVSNNQFAEVFSPQSMKMLLLSVAFMKNGPNLSCNILQKQFADSGSRSLQYAPREQTGGHDRHHLLDVAQLPYQRPGQLAVVVYYTVVYRQIYFPVISPAVLLFL